MEKKKVCGSCDFNNCNTPCVKWLRENLDWLNALPIEKLLKRMYHCAFNIGVITANGESVNLIDYNNKIRLQNDKYRMYETELKRRLN